MSAHYGRHGYLLCDGRDGSRRCRTFHVAAGPVMHPTGPGDVLHHLVDTYREARDGGWDAPGHVGPHLCTDHKGQTATAVVEQDRGPDFNRDTSRAFQIFADYGTADAVLIEAGVLHAGPHPATVTDADRGNLRAYGWLPAGERFALTQDRVDEIRTLVPPQPEPGPVVTLTAPVLAAVPDEQPALFDADPAPAPTA